MPSVSDVAKRLLELTRTGRIKWQHMEPPDSIAVGTDSKILTFFGAIFKGRNIGVYEERYRGYDVESDTQFWANRYVLVFFDSGWDVGWEAPATPGIAALLDAIKYQRTNVDAIMDDILSTDSEG